mgnify:CR=1 FL=1
MEWGFHITNFVIDALYALAMMLGFGLNPHAQGDEVANNAM